MPGGDGEEQKGGRIHNLPIDFSSADVAQRLVLHARLVPQFPRGESIFARHSSVNEVDRPAPNIGLRSKPARVSVQRGTITKGNEVERGGGTDPSSTRTSRGTSNVYAPLNSSPVWRLSLYESFSFFPLPFFSFPKNDPRDDFLLLAIVTPTPLRATLSPIFSLLGTDIYRKGWWDGRYVWTFGFLVDRTSRIR